MLRPVESAAKPKRHSGSSWPFSRPTCRIFSVGNCGKRHARGAVKFPSLPNWFVARSASVSQLNVGWRLTAKTLALRQVKILMARPGLQQNRLSPGPTHAGCDRGELVEHNLRRRGHEFFAPACNRHQM